MRLIEHGESKEVGSEDDEFEFDCNAEIGFEELRGKEMKESEEGNGDSG